MPKVSFLCPSYNHEKYIRTFLESILAQTNPDWELIIVDDHSSDGNVGIIKKFSDPRIKLIEHTYNQGINGALSSAFERSSAPLIIMVDSDDLVLPECVEKVLRAFTNPAVDVLASSLRYMDGDGRPLETSRPLPTDWTRERLFAEMALVQNMLPWPGLSMRRNVLESVMPLHNGIINYQDWLVNIRLVHDFNVRLSDDPIVIYRRGHSGNVDDVRSPAVAFRESAEIFHLMDEAEALVGSDALSFKRWMGSCESVRGLPVEDDTVSFVMGLLATRSPEESRRRWGLHRLQRCMSTRAMAERLQRLYGFDYAQFLALSKPYKKSASVVPTAEVYNEEIARLRRKVKKYRKLTVVFASALAVVILCALVLSFG